MRNNSKRFDRYQLLPYKADYHIWNMRSVKGVYSSLLLQDPSFSKLIEMYIFSTNLFGSLSHLRRSLVFLQQGWGKINTLNRGQRKHLHLSDFLRVKLFLKGPTQYSTSYNTVQQQPQLSRFLQMENNDWLETCVTNGMQAVLQRKQRRFGMQPCYYVGNLKLLE